MLVYRSYASITILKTGPRSLSQPWIKAWNYALEKLRTNPNLLLTTRLLAVGAELEIAMDGSGVMPGLRTKLLAAVKEVDLLAKYPNSPKAVAAILAYQKRSIVEVELAESSLVKAATESKIPWYLYTYLSEISRDKCDLEGAYHWSKMAADSVKRRASRLEWCTKHLVLMIDPQAKFSAERRKSSVASFYRLALKLPDGFLGRNRLRIDKIEAAFERIVAAAPIRG